jgi:hypothetical protein
MSARPVGRATQPATQARHPRALTSGERASAKSRSSNVATAPTARFISLSEAVIYGHLAGEHTVGMYPLLEDDSCYFLAVDFDEAEWRDDARGLCNPLRSLAYRLRWRFLGPPITKAEGKRCASDGIRLKHAVNATFVAIVIDDGENAMALVRWRRGRWFICVWDTSTSA